jgi:DNA-binding FrmR family transcriptional regulator
MSTSIRDPHRQSLVNRLKRVEGQIRGVQAMIESEQECAAIAQQLTAARRALDRAFYEMIGCAMQGEIGRARSLAAASDASASITELLVKYG